MQTRQHRIIATIVSSIIFASMILALFIWQYQKKQNAINPDKFHGTLLNEPRGVAPFSLTGIDEKTFDNTSLQGQWTYVFFGFTSCGYVCPTTLTELARMYQLLVEKNVEPRPRIVFISLDPSRDTLSKLKKYVRAFHPDFYGARGEEPEVIKLAHEMGVASEKVPLSSSNTDTNYDIQHTGALMLFNPKGELRAFFTTPHQAEKLSQDYQMLVASQR